jgi:hypothetical protein
VIQVDYVATTTFMANGKEIKRGAVIKGKEVAKWLNYQLLETAGYIRRIESSGE